MFIQDLPEALTKAPATEAGAAAMSSIGNIRKDDPSIFYLPLNLPGFNLPQPDYGPVSGFVPE
jgi:hypothetical protein